MRFPFGNKIPWSTIVEINGERKPDVLIGIPGDMEFESYKNGQIDAEGLVFLVGRKKGSRALLIAINPISLSLAIATTPEPPQHRPDNVK